MYDIKLANEQKEIFMDLVNNIPAQARNLAGFVQNDFQMLIEDKVIDKNMLQAALEELKGAYKAVHLSLDVLKTRQLALINKFIDML